MDEPTIGPVDIEATHKVMARVTGAEPRELRGRHYWPQSIEVTWRRTTDTAWRGGSVSLYGPQIRKDGSTGAREIHEYFWTGHEHTWPEFVQEFFEVSKP